MIDPAAEAREGIFVVLALLVSLVVQMDCAFGAKSGGGPPGKSAKHAVHRSSPHPGGFRRLSSPRGGERGKQRGGR